METKQGIWGKPSGVKYFTGKAGVLFYQVFHQSSNLDCFCDRLKIIGY
jgi:hypothetical protein